MKRFLILALTLVCAIPALAQMTTSYAPAKFNFVSEPAGAQVYFDGKLLGTTPFSAEVKPAYRTQGGKPGASEFEIYTSNTRIIEKEINDSGAPEGIVSRFALEFKFVMPDGAEIQKKANLMWKSVTILNMPGFNIYYPPLQKVKQ